jgi:hypothetical protein
VLKTIRNFVVIALIALVGWYAIARIVDRSAIRRLEAKARARGEPLTINELIATLPNIPDEENAALKLIAVWAEDNPQFWKSFLSGGRPEPPAEPEYDPALPYLGKIRLTPGQQLTVVSLRASDSYLSSRSNHIQAVRLALKAPRARFPIRLQETYNVLVPHLRRLKTEAMIFRLQALHQAVAGDVAGSMESIADILRISETLNEEPLLISQLVKTACAKMALLSAEDLLTRQTLSHEQLEELEKLFQPIAPRKMMRVAMISERSEALNIFTDPGNMTARLSDPEVPSAAETRRGMKFYWLTGLTLPDRRLMLETTEELVAAAQDVSTNAFRRVKGIEDSLNAKALRFPPKIFSGMLIPTAKATGRFIELEAGVRSLNVACAVERYRLSHAKLPDSLTALVPEYMAQVPIDPFDGLPVRYRASGQGYVLYSVGPDLVDNQGTKAAKTGEGDETFTVNR